MGTAGLAGQPLIKNQKGAHATTGVRPRRVRPPRPIETDHEPQGLCAVIWRHAGMHGYLRILRSVLNPCSALGLASLPGPKGLLRRVP